MEALIYHVLNRGVDKRKIFMNEKDYFRFIHNLFEFNNQDKVISNSYFFNQLESSDIGCQKIEKKPRKLLVKIHAFCLMPNHYHLLISPLVEDGIPRFMKKINMGYAKYFNKKYKRSGALFQGKYKYILIEKESHFIHIPYYIHLNPLDLVCPEWRDGKLKKSKDALNFLKKYRWSSHLDYAGNKNFPSVTQRDFLLDFFEGKEEYKRSIDEWLKNMDVSAVDGMTLE